VLHPVPVDELLRCDGFFRCDPYSATITGITCLRRQRSASMNEQRSRKERLQGVGLGHDSRCVDCPLGRTVAARLKVLADGAPCKVKKAKAKTKAKRKKRRKQ
jgi:hypothetical protein